MLYKCVKEVSGFCFSIFFISSHSSWYVVCDWLLPIGLYFSVFPLGKQTCVKMLLLSCYFFLITQYHQGVSVVLAELDTKVRRFYSLLRIFAHALDDAHVNESREYSTRLIPFMCTTSTQYFERTMQGKRKSLASRRSRNAIRNNADRVDGSVPKQTRD